MWPEYPARLPSWTLRLFGLPSGPVPSPLRPMGMIVTSLDPTNRSTESVVKQAACHAQCHFVHVVLADLGHVLLGAVVLVQVVSEWSDVCVLSFGVVVWKDAWCRR